MKPTAMIAGVLATQLLAASALADDNWFVRPYAGLSQMSDLSADFDNIDSLSGEADVNLDSGFTGGLGVGYRFDERLALEFGWEYRSNDSSVTLNDASGFEGGNYASNLFYLNGHYFLKASDKWQPYVGAGLTWVEEIDIDLERGGQEQSYSGDGETGYQIFAGVNYELNKDWELQTELRYGSITDISLQGESGTAGEITGIDYETTTLQLGLVYQF